MRINEDEKSMFESSNAKIVYDRSYELHQKEDLNFEHLTKLGGDILKITIRFTDKFETDFQSFADYPFDQLNF